MCTSLRSCWRISMFPFPPCGASSICISIFFCAMRAFLQYGHVISCLIGPKWYCRRRALLWRGMCFFVFTRLLQSPIRHSHSVVCGFYSATPISPHVVCCLLFSSPALFLGAHGHGWHFLLDLLIPPPVCTASSRTSSSSGVSSLSDVVCSAVWVPTFCLVLVFSRPSGLFIFPWFPCFCFFWFSWSFLVLG